MCVCNFWTTIILCCVFLLSSVVMAEKSKSIGYDSVEQAFAALESDPNAVLTEYEGWKIFNKKEGNTYVLWSFTPPFHFAASSVIRRSIVNSDGEVQITMDALCHSAKIYCDALIEQFRVINKKLKNTMELGS